jgi:hypothetical protein
VTASNFRLFDPSSAVVPGALTLLSDGLTATFTPAAALMPNANYTISVVSLTDQAGNTVTRTYSSLVRAHNNGAAGDVHPATDR